MFLPGWQEVCWGKNSFRSFADFVVFLLLRQAQNSARGRNSDDSGLYLSFCSRRRRRMLRLAGYFLSEISLVETEETCYHPALRLGNQHAPRPFWL